MRSSSPVRPARSAVLWRFAARFVPALLACLAAVLLLQARERAQDREVAVANANGALAVQHRMLDRELGMVVSMLRSLASTRTIVEFVAGEGDRAAVESDFVELCRHSALFDQVRILDSRGTEVVRVDFADGVATPLPQAALQSKASRYYFQVSRELEPLEVYVSPFDLNVEHGEIETPWKPVIRLLTRAASGSSDAVVILNYLGGELLDRLRAASGQMVGWSALVNGEGHYLEGPSREVSWRFMFDEAPTLPGSHPDVWAALASGNSTGESGNRLTPEGMFAFRRFQADSTSGPLRSDLDLSLVTFTPNSMLYAESNRVLRVLAVAGSVLVLLLAAGIWQLAYAGEVRAAHERRLERSEQHLRELSARLLEAQETERRNVARDLHDELGQLATAVTLDLKQAQRRPEQREELLERAIRGVDGMLQGVRSISSQLRTSLLDDLGLRDALVEHCTDFAARTELQVDLEFEIADERIPPDAAIHLFRIVQESLNNVSRHSGASHVDVRIDSESEGIAVVVSDNGAGFEAGDEREGALGLTGMQERVELLAGQMSIESEPPHGTTVRAWIPNAAASDAAPGSEEASR